MGTYDWVAEALLSPEGSVFTAFDIETTGLDPKVHRIVEIGAVKFDRRGVIGRFSALINPGIPMPPEASAINGITDEQLADKPPVERVLPDFLRFIGTSVLVAHNASFDCSFINAALGAFYSDGGLLWQAPFPSLPTRIVDTLTFAKETFPGRPNYKLQNLAAFLDLESKNAHRAEDDARLCMELLLQCVHHAQEK
jgi:DNA polymerase-3 subunit epsilon